jgi:hypothetical protein
MITAADLAGLDWAYKGSPLCPTSPTDIDTLTLDWAFGGVPFVAYPYTPDVPPPPPPPPPPTPPTSVPVLNGFIINILDPQPLMTEITAGYNADFVLPLTDSMYVVTHPASDSLIKRFADETIARLPCVFWTRDEILARPTNLGVLQVVGRYDGPNIIGAALCTVFADGAAVFTHNFVFRTTHGQQIIRLPSGFKARRWSVLVEATEDVQIAEVNLAGTADELRIVSP